ncbi:helix-turn-helix domain-containing protein [Achromobacter denitrificans]|uniref:helix-turn-helix domain-containing protein n=1 Tax=Achromobacter denitrificans TaxID=32002 RepID=UPI000788A6B3|nr:AraC family transcriptional regulator [Achromobacter denitrificans]MPT37669.1 AraC family transcriptional regulator [Achromobacter sp.]MDF3848857.1 AraC family transcriptional regulator [Achromobacter denitrificans]QCS61820.1 helix-turn-helix transcriptional regulator [Achromobacter denitrificans]QKH45371.1 helix-turn-helix transcriptional regulator [Achromobacter denitrificans]QKH53287.1 helix-turn-helix transcriptional regulator [Achromobacter denitrificans]
MPLAQQPPAVSVIHPPYCIGALRTPLLAAARFRHVGDHKDARVQPIPQARAYSVIFQMQDFASHKLWVDRKLIHAGGHSRASIALTDLTHAYACQHLSDYDNVRLQIRNDVLEELGGELYAGKVPGLRLQQGAEDETMRLLVQALLPSLMRREPGDEAFIEHLTLAMVAHLLRRYGQAGMRGADGRAAGKLSGPQLAKAAEYVEAHLAQNIALADIARHCGMSRATFARAFKAAMGTTPFAWIRERRLEHAMSLLRQSDLSLADISAECGFSDQSHFARSFTRNVGVAPRAWRSEQRK